PLLAARRKQGFSTRAYERILHQMMLQCIAGGGATRRNSQFVVDRANMGIDSCQTNKEFLCNERATQTLSKQSQDFLLSWCQFMQVGNGPFLCRDGRGITHGWS